MSLFAALRTHPELSTAAILTALYVALRTLGAADVVMYVWTAGVAASALAMPLSGLAVLAALGPVSEAQSESGAITFVPILLATTGLSVALRLIATRGRPLNSVGIGLAAPVLGAVAVGVVTFAGVGISWLGFGSESGAAALQLWVPGIGGGITVMVAAAWAAASRRSEVLVVTVGAVVIASAISLIDFLGGGVLTGSPIGWLIRDHDANRLGEIIPAPNVAAAIFLAAAAVTLGAAAFADDLKTRAIGVAASATLAIATAFTYSRSGLLAGMVIAGLVAIRSLGQLPRDRRRLAVLAATALALATVAALAAGLSPFRNVPGFADEARMDAWWASIGMWLDAPIIGRGFRSFEWLHEAYGSSLDAPHNEWLRFFAEEGLVGGLVGLALICSAMLALLRRRDWLTYSCGAAATALAVMASFNNPFMYAQANVPIFLIIGSGVGLAIGRAVERGPAESEPGSSGPAPATSGQCN